MTTQPLKNKPVITEEIRAAVDNAAAAARTTAQATSNAAAEAIDTGRQTAARAVDSAFSAGKEQFEKMGQTVFRSFDELSGYGKDNVEAMLQAGAIVARGWENIGRHWFSYAQFSVEQGVQTAKSMMTAKSFRDVVDLQSGYARSSFDSLVAESTKLSELAVKVANEAFGPLNARLNATVEKMQKPVAA